MAKKTKHTYYPEAKVTCSMDGSEYTLGMTTETEGVDICGNTHPFYTGKEQLVDTAGRIEKFKARAKKAEGEELGKDKKKKKRKTKLSIADLMSDDDSSKKDTKIKVEQKAPEVTE